MRSRRGVILPCTCALSLTSSATPRASDLTRILFVLSFAAGCSSASMRVTDALLPALSTAFEVTLGTAAQAVTAFAVAYGVMQLVFGPIGDRHGKLRTIAWACVGAALASLACSLAPDFTTLTWARGFTGAFASALIPLSMAWIGDQIRYDLRQAILARFLMGQMLGVALGQVAGGLAADLLAWRVPFVLFAGLYLLAAWALYPHRGRDDAGLSQAPPAGPGSRLGRVLAQPWARWVLLVVCIEGALLFGAMTFVATHLHLRFGLPLSMAAAMLLGFPAGGLVYSTFTPWLVRRFGESGLARLGGLLGGLGLLTFALTPWWQAAIPASVLCGMGFYMFHNTLQMQATQMLPAQRGAAVSVFACTLFLGMSAGVYGASRSVEWLGGEAGAATAIGVCGAGLALLGWVFSRSLRHRPV